MFKWLHLEPRQNILTADDDEIIFKGIRKALLPGRPDQAVFVQVCNDDDPFSSTTTVSAEKMEKFVATVDSLPEAEEDIDFPGYPEIVWIQNQRRKLAYQQALRKMKTLKR